MASTGTLSSCYCSNSASVSPWIHIVKRLPGPPTDNVPSTWIAQMLQRDRGARWTAHTLAEHIREYSSDPTAPFAFTGLCCLVDDDTAESVHSSIGEHMNNLTIRPTISCISKLHPSEPIPLSSQTEAVPHYLGSVSKPRSTRDGLGYVPLLGAPSLQPNQTKEIGAKGEKDPVGKWPIGTGRTSGVEESTMFNWDSSRRQIISVEYLKDPCRQLVELLNIDITDK
ncbi:hypothetical protein K505DRAFT_337318 [Melanomma pulvis-pyrius CBS 109.77]|uniref:Uncharacterized protein n=1 Tax=Melanomma pulvis-pyrius CBS 109.77 TaxID=1314802 RepID=A0A6A6XD77_9PLEO|nr:hypothetical protein K505DRAFT_337318 [Melanomma pulvis-pyrius CBS 109.77]